MSQQMDVTGKLDHWAVSWGGTSLSVAGREGLGEATDSSDHPREERKLRCCPDAVPSTAERSSPGTLNITLLH